MAETGKEITDRLVKSVESELESLKPRLEIGSKLLEAELSDSKREGLLERWKSLDTICKRLQLVHAVLVSPQEAPCTGVYCAVCLKLVTPEQLLDSGWEVPPDEQAQA